MSDDNKLVLGMGCDRNTSQQTLEIAIDQALTLINGRRDAISAVATIDKKNDESGLLNLVKQHGWPIHFFTAQQLAQIEVPNPSEVVRKYMGTPAVAEAAALLAAALLTATDREKPNTNTDDLVLEKHKYRGSDDKNATVSIVRLN